MLGKPALLRPAIEATTAQQKWIHERQADAQVMRYIDLKPNDQKPKFSKTAKGTGS